MFIIKTVQKGEHAFLRKLLPGYYMVGGQTGVSCHERDPSCYTTLHARDTQR